ncbi:MAG: hypothetical protein ACTSYO_00200, partial [Candidatus Ranarchaeia archaeon]
NEIVHLKEVNRHGIGTLAIEDIELLGEDLAPLRRKFLTPKEAPPLDPAIYGDEHPHWACAMKEAREKYGDKWKTL